MNSSSDMTNMHEAKTQLSQLVERALNGDEVIIARHGKPVVRLVPYFPETGWNKTFQDWLLHGEAFELKRPTQDAAQVHDIFGDV
jgi:prevent-host-death family protein